MRIPNRGLMRAGLWFLAVAVFFPTCASPEKPERLPLPCRADTRLAVSEPAAAQWIGLRTPVWTNHGAALLCFVHGPAAADPRAACQELERVLKTAWRYPVAAFLAREAAAAPAVSNALLAALQATDPPEGLVQGYGEAAWEYRRRPLTAGHLCEGVVAASRRVLIDTALLHRFLERLLGERAAVFAPIFQRPHQ